MTTDRDPAYQQWLREQVESQPPLPRDRAQALADICADIESRGEIK